MKILYAALCAVLGLGSVAYADERPGVYFGGGIGAYGLDLDNVDFDDRSRFLRAVVGYRISDHLAVEGDYLKLFETSGDIFGADADLDADVWGISLRPILPITDRIDLYGRVGWSWYDVDVTSNAFGIPLTADSKDNDFTWGGGLDFRLTDNVSLRGDFSRIEIDDANLNFLSAQVTFRF
ncbi:MAG: porin family protein [Gammaproteobacteria bacterium]|nr:porin family protein [Gammaproteobacteria bacterium]